MSKRKEPVAVGTLEQAVIEAEDVATLDFNVAVWHVGSLWRLEWARDRAGVVCSDERRPL